jgi:hypothetical protein
MLHAWKGREKKCRKELEGKGPVGKDHGVNGRIIFK